MCVRAEWYLTLCDSWTVPRQAPLSIGFSRQELWNGLPFPSPGGPLEPGIEPVSLASPAIAGGFFTTEPPGKPFPYSSVGKQSTCNVET